MDLKKPKTHSNEEWETFVKDSGLNEQQSQWIHCVSVQKINSLLTGAAGSGKTFTLIRFMQWSMKIKRNVSITAMTGTACNQLSWKNEELEISPLTLHAWMGKSREKETSLDLASRIRKYAYTETGSSVFKRWTETEILIIDEASMLSIALFLELDVIAKVLRRNYLPFGGIQILLCGDFAQLPPIEEDIDYPFLFQHPYFQEQFECTFLRTNYRQKDDVEYANLLDSIRNGTFTNHEILISRIHASVDLPVHLLPRVHQVQSINHKEYQKLDTEEKIFAFDYRIHGKIPEENIHRMKENMKQKISSLMQDPVHLRIGMPVILLVNLSLKMKLVNGLQGMIEGFDQDLPIVKFHNGLKIKMKMHCFASQEYRSAGNTWKGIQLFIMPLAPAWAMTIHKIQGASLNGISLDLGEHIFARNQGYVGLSRVTTLKGLSLLDYSPKSIQMNPYVMEFYKQFE